ncbi:hypothetical protein [Roseovarius sp. D0-M9]|uniref:hypothetical protein n=1 Tax=Roseovarius sp. D0-M9 TaxID=3127117 RepID=UPI00300FAE41
MSEVIRLFGPLVLWLASFSAVYGVHGIACAQGWTHTPVVAAAGVALALQVAFLLVLTSQASGMQRGVSRWASITLAIIGIIAVIWTLFPVVVLTACTSFDAG